MELGAIDEAEQDYLESLALRRKASLPLGAAYCEANLTGYKRPKVVEFRSELPKTPVGKVLRRELRDAPK